MGAAIPSTPSSARPSITERGMSASRSIAAASMWVSANSRTAATAASTVGRSALGQLGIGEERVAAEFAPEQGLGEPALLRPREEQFLRLLELLGPQAPASRLGDAAWSGAEVVTAMTPVSSDVAQLECCRPSGSGRVESSASYSLHREL